MPLNNQPNASSFVKCFLVFCSLAVSAVHAAPLNRITRPVNTSLRKAVAGGVHRSALPRYDQGPADAAMLMQYMVLTVKPSAAQQADLDTLLTEQQNPASQNFHKWVTPDDFADRFGLSESDHGKVLQWLTSEGFTINESGRGRNWVAFSGSAGQVSRSLGTSVHRFQVLDETHYATTTDPLLPGPIADVTAGIIGLHDFRLKSNVRLAHPNYTSGSFHYITPEDFSTIYNVAPLLSNGFDGTGQSIAIVGATNVALSDIRAFKNHFNLPANDPKVVFYGGINPGTNSDILEADLDLEWAGAMAPKASLYYYYGQDVFTALVTAINANLAQVISVSYGGCELDFAASYFRSVAQQANAQGITILVASGDRGAAGCDYAGSDPQASQGSRVSFPAVLPEVTAVGGTQFNDQGGAYWRTTNTANGGSALSYIPELAWNESDDIGPLSGGGGISNLYPRPAWQKAPGVPEGNVRYVPDVALAASVEIDPYYVYSQGGPTFVGGTSAPTPAMSGVVALLNQYLVKNQTLKQPGLGNINPQLYRLFQAAPLAFHDTLDGSNRVPCIQGSVDCLTGFVGYQAAPGYDLATGLGSFDFSTLFAQWTSTGKTASITLSTNAARLTLNDFVVATVAVSGTDASPTGTIDFSIAGRLFGSAPLVVGPGNTSTATLAIQLGVFAVGTYVLTTSYSGDVAFNGGGATTSIRITAPAAGTSAIVLSGPYQVWPATPPDIQGQVFQTPLTLRETGGVPAVVTGFTIDGQTQELSQFFPTTAIAANGTLSLIVKSRNVITPSTKTFGFIGLDASGTVWNRQIAVTYFPNFLFDDFSLTAATPTVAQNLANPACQWPVRLNITDLGGFTNVITGLLVGNVDYTDQVTSIFGTPRLQELGSLQGTICLNDLTVPGKITFQVNLSNQDAQQVTVSFTGPAPAPVKLSVFPSALTLASASERLGTGAATATLSVNLPDNSQSWTATITPTNRTTGWLSASQLSGIGSGQILLSASGAGYEPGIYRATVTVQASGASPQFIAVPLSFLYNGGNTGTVISGVGNAAAPNQSTLAPGMLLTIVGSNLANTTRTTGTFPLPFSAYGVSAQVNGLQAPILFISPTQINIQVPYSAGAGSGVIGINNNGQVAGVPIQIVPAAPGIFTDASNFLLPVPMINQDGVLTLYLTGVGDVNPLIASGDAPAPKTAAGNLPKPILPLQATIGGYPVFIQFSGIGGGLVGINQVNLIVPESVPLGVQDVIVTVNGVSSNPAKVIVLRPK